MSILNLNGNVGGSSNSNGEIYSPEEVRIGTYLGKPLYRRTFEFENVEILSASSIVLLNADWIQAIKKARVFGNIYYSNGYSMQIPHFIWTEDNTKCYSLNIVVAPLRKTLELTMSRVTGPTTTSTFNLTFNFSVTIEYTKTTD